MGEVGRGLWTLEVVCAPPLQMLSHLQVAAQNGLSLPIWMFYISHEEDSNITLGNLCQFSSHGHSEEFFLTFSGNFLFFKLCALPLSTIGNSLAPPSLHPLFMYLCIDKNISDPSLLWAELLHLSQFFLAGDIHKLVWVLSLEFLQYVHITTVFGCLSSIFYIPAIAKPLNNLWSFPATRSFRNATNSCQTHVAAIIILCLSPKRKLQINFLSIPPVQTE